MNDAPARGSAGGPGSPDLPCEAWEGCVAPALASRWSVPAVHLYETVGSTNDIARRLASSGAEPGTVVLAERQVTGRGRAGRTWESPPGVGLWVSMIVSAPSDAAAAGLLPLRVGIAVARALDLFVGPGQVGVKWPNDLLAGGLKLGGILCESAWVGSAQGPVVVGVGLNALQREEDLPPHLSGVATSIRMASGRPVERLTIADAVVAALVDDIGERQTRDRLASELERRDVLRGRMVEVTDPDTGERRLTGLAMGIAPDGALLVQPHEGPLRAIRSGSIRLATPPAPATRPTSGT